MDGPKRPLRPAPFVRCNTWGRYGYYWSTWGGANFGDQRGATFQVRMKAGDVVAIGAAASRQFIVRPIALRVIRVEAADTNDDYRWLDGYELSMYDGNALERRRVFVLPAGVVVAATVQAAIETVEGWQRDRHS